jgi:hypothetical protein
MGVLPNELDFEFHGSIPVARMARDYGALSESIILPVLEPYRHSFIRRSEYLRHPISGFYPMFQVEAVWIDSLFR